MKKMINFVFLCFIFDKDMSNGKLSILNHFKVWTNKYKYIIKEIYDIIWIILSDFNLRES